MNSANPKNCYGRNPRSLNIPRSIVEAAVQTYGFDPSRAEITELLGGFMNANFRVDVAGVRFVVRVYSSAMNIAQREFDTLSFLGLRDVLTPKPHAIFEIAGRPVVILQLLPGITLEDRLLLGEVVDHSLFEDVGRQLGLLHSITFKKPGFILEGLKISEDFSDFGNFLREFILQTCTTLKTSPVHVGRLNLETIARVEALLNEKWNAAVRREKPATQFVHCDFNPKNILVTALGPAVVTGILDWEFSMSGDGLSDFGNFFRFDEDYVAGSEGAFAEGYRASGRHLRDGWRESSLLLDLANMFSFLEVSEDYQESFQTARTVIESTLKHFGY